MRDSLPFQSMEDRLPKQSRQGSSVKLSTVAVAGLSNLEGLFEDSRSYRSRFLKQLHENMVDLFINSPGFGVTRRIRPSEASLAYELRKEPAPLQPGAASSVAWSPANAPPKLSDSDYSDLGSLNGFGILDFAYPSGWGYIRERKQVAGFEAHRFSKVPDGKVWKVETLDLVSLLLHDDPAVYVSERLPQMDKVHDVPTRPLDTFESCGLESLRQGEDLFIGGTASELRMLGAVRSIKQCLDCHGGERGDLLGAFSYSLRREKVE